MDRDIAYHARENPGYGKSCTPGPRFSPGESGAGKFGLAPRNVGRPCDDLVGCRAPADAGPYRSPAGRCGVQYHGHRRCRHEIVELPTILSHVLSYTRLVGVGLSSVAIAMVVNFIAIDLIITPQLENLTILGVVFIIVGVAVFIIGQLLNMILGLIGGGLQSIRLNYVEFFTKFYKGGGVKYNPFGIIRQFTED
jgi:hypothetical protein